MIGHFHAKAITAMTGGTLHSVFDLRQEAADKLATEYGAKAYSNMEEFLADDELEIVTVGTPSGAHLDPTLAALNAGKHAIVEKPLEITTERIDQLMAAAEANGKTLAAVLNRRFHPGMDAFKKAADEGRFGVLASASAYIKWFRDQAYYDSAAWRGTWALDGGGSLMNQSIHTVDALIYLAGPVKSVQANTALLAHERIEVEDHCVAIVEFENGVRGLLNGNRLSDHAANNTRLTMGEMRIEGSDGVLTLDGDGVIRTRKQGCSDAKAHDYQWQDIDFGADCVYRTNRHIADHLLNGLPIQNLAEDYLQNRLVEEAVYSVSYTHLTLPTILLV